MTVIQLVEDALRAQASTVQADPHAVDRIREQLLVEDTARRPARSGAVRVLSAAAAVVAVAGVAALVGTSLAGHGDGGGDRAGGTTGLPGYPLVPSQYFVAQRGTDGTTGEAADVVVRVADRQVVGTFPTVDASKLIEPQLAPDGTRAYAVFGRTGSSVGYVDLLSGAVTTVDRRSGELYSPTLSADGTTLAYGWAPSPTAPETVVVRDLRSGATRQLTGLPNSPLEQPLALSPDGRQLAYVDTNNPFRLGLVATTRSGDVFARPQVIAPYPCSGAGVTSVHWTARTLYATQTCNGYLKEYHQVLRATSHILQVDVERRSVESLHKFATPQTSLGIAVIDRAGSPLFATTTTAIPGAVQVRDPADGWRARPVVGVTDLDVAGH